MRFEAIGTHWEIDVYEPVNSSTFSELKKAIKNRIKEFDNHYSRFKANSLVSQIAKERGTYQLPDDSKKLIGIYDKLNKATKGLLNPCIGNSLSDLGYDDKYSLRTKKVVRKTPDWSSLTFKKNNLTTTEPVLLDFGAAGKGYLVDIVSNIIIESGIKNFCVDGSGDMAHKGDMSITVGLEDPNNPENALGTVELKNQSLAGSSGSRRKWGDYHHIINPKNNTSPKDIIATWVVSDECIIADALTTCLFLVSSEKLVNTYKFEYLVLYRDYSIKKSANFPATLFT